MEIGVGVNAWVWTAPFTQKSRFLLAKAKEMGFDVFTIPVEEPSAFDPKGLRQEAQDLGLRLNVTGAFGPTRDLTHEDPQYRRESLNYIQETLAICETLGAKLMVGPMYSAVGKRRHVTQDQKKKEWDLAVDGLRKAAKMASDHGVVLAIEALNRFETDLVNTAEQVKRLVQDVDAKAVRIHLDTFHMNIEEKSIYDAVVLAGSDLAYVDASENDRGTPGLGQVDWQGLARGLRDIGYSGDCVIESFTPQCTTIASAAAIWRSLAPSQDLLASEGCKFLKQLLHD